MEFCISITNSAFARRDVQEFFGFFMRLTQLSYNLETAAHFYDVLMLTVMLSPGQFVSHLVLDFES